MLLKSSKKKEIYSREEGDSLSLIIKDIDLMVTMDRSNRIMRNASIVILGDKIVDIGSYEALLKKWKAGEVIEGRGKIALPGLIDVHGHSTQSALRGFIEEVPLMPWLTYMQDTSSKMGNELAEIGCTITFIEKLKCGVTTSVDMENDVDLVARVASKLGCRVILAGILADVEEVPYSGLKRTSSVEEEIKKADHWFTKYHGKDNGRLMFFYGPVGFPASSAELLRASAERAREVGTRIHTHVAEGWITNELCKKVHGLREVELLEKIGFLGPDTLLAHCVQLNESDIHIISKYRASVAHCPSSNSKLGNGICPVLELIWHDVNVGLGCDGAASNNSQDLFVEMKIAALLQKAVHRNATILPAQKVLQMATIGGAKAVGLEKYIGSIEVGKKADIILIDRKKPYLIPLDNVVSHLVYNTKGDAVSTVIIDGKIIIENGRFKEFDEGGFLERAESKFSEFTGKYT
jgi:5-methylthioadenosine/S-adenosylhomocysteine deaminase